MPSNSQFKIGKPVVWKWMGRFIKGKVVEIYDVPIIKDIKGKKIKRLGSPENPAIFVVSESGNYALKLSSELTLDVPNNSSAKKARPKIFS